MSDLHFIYENDKVYAIREGKVVASADTLAELEPKVAWMDNGFDDDPAASGGYHADPFGAPGRAEWDNPDSPHYDQPCPNCHAREGAFEGGQCAACGYAEHGGHGGLGGPEEGSPYGDPGDDFPDHGPIQASKATHVVTPNGLKGKILGSVKDLWGDTVTVRLENGRVAHLRVTEDTKFSTEKTASTGQSVIENLTARLEAPFDSSRRALTERLAKLEDIRSEAVAALRTASHADAETLDNIVIAADGERGTLRQAIDAIDAQEAEAFSYKPLEYTAGPVGESFGGSDASWLDNVAADMAAEAEGTDFDSVLNDEPALFVSDLSDGTVADMGSTREMALSHIRSKVAGLASERAQEIERTFVANVEEARRAELSTRKETTHKEAASREDKYANLPDDILFS